MAETLPEMVERIRHKTTEQLVQITVSVDKIEATISSRKQLHQLLEELTDDFLRERRSSLEEKVQQLLPEEGDNFPHRCVPIRGKVTRGARDSLAPLLASIRPKLAQPIQRIGERQPLNPEIASQIANTPLERHNLLVDGMQRTSSKRLRGPRGYIQAGNYPETDHESLAKLFFASQIVTDDIWTGDVLTEVLLESGLPLLNTQLVVKQENWYLEMEGKYPLEEFHDLFAWHAFDYYVSLFGDTDLAAQVHSKWPKDPPGFSEALQQLKLCPNKKNLIMGDIAIIQYIAFKKPTVFSGVTTMPQLFARLEKLPYPRLAESKDVNLRQRLEKMVKSMAIPLESAKIVQIDWGPLLKAVHFHQQPPKG